MPMITALVFIAALVILARMSWPKERYVPLRATLTGIIGGALVRIVLFFVFAGIALVLFAAAT